MYNLPYYERIKITKFIRSLNSVDIESILDEDDELLLTKEEPDDNDLREGEEE